MTSFRSWLKGMLLNCLSVINVYPVEQTNKDGLVNLIHNLHPRVSGHELLRMGPVGDGGYIVPNDLHNLGGCFSPGVDAISGFEKECAQRGMPVFMADLSVDRPADQDQNFHFIKKYIGATTNEQYITLDDWVNKSLPSNTNDLLLQMDVEGAEYEIIFNTSENLMRRFRIMVIEFHALDMLHSRFYFQLVQRAFTKILQTHTCIHIHPNNRCGSVQSNGIEIPVAAEFTFIRNDRIRGQGFATLFPHPLDHDNIPGRSLTLPHDWYNSTPL